MQSNIVFIPCISTGDGRSSPYSYSIKSWEYWCKKNNCELVILDQLLCDIEYMKITWQRYHLLDILKNSKIEYDQVLMVDADTIVHPNCPNFFDMTEHKLVGVHNEGSYDWICRSMENYHKYMFSDSDIPFSFWEYINTGFIIFNEKHKQFLDEFLEFYKINRETIISLQEQFHVGTCQPVFNYLLRRKNIEYKLLPYEFNMCDLTCKEILDEDFTMTKVGWIYHYNAISQEFQKSYGDVHYWMKKTYDHLYGGMIG